MSLPALQMRFNKLTYFGRSPVCYTKGEGNTERELINFSNVLRVVFHADYYSQYLFLRLLR